MEINTAKELIDELDEIIPDGPYRRDSQRFAIPVLVVDHLGFEYPKKIIDVRITGDGVELVIRPMRRNELHSQQKEKNED